MRIQNNIAADNSNRQLGINTRNIAANTEKLSSGYRVNRAADDAAGLAISEKMRTQIRGLDRASLNIQDGVSLLQIGDGALQKLTDLMQRMRELSVQSANDTNELLDREAIQLEFGQLTSEINDIVSKTNFNERKLFDGSIGASFDYHMGKIMSAYTATIGSTNDFSSPVNVAGWTTDTTPAFGVTDDVVVNLGPPTVPFPTSGVFAMQIVTPADGTLNVILDFGKWHLENGGSPMTRDEFFDYFKTGFNSLGLGHVVNGIEYDGVWGRISFDFPKNGTTLTGVMGKPNAWAPAPPTPPASVFPRVFVGVGVGPTESGAQGSAAQRNSLNEIASGWTTPPFRTYNPSGIVINESTVFANSTIFGSANRPLSTAPPAGGPPGGFSSVTLTVGTTSTKINLIPGSYPDIQSFIDANREAFLSAGFDLVAAEDGTLQITARLFGGDTPPSVTVSTNNVAFLGISTEIVVEPAPDESLWIQSGANEGDGIGIEIPNLSARSLGLAIRRPADESEDSYINSQGADGYTTVANVTGDPMEYSLDVTSHEKAGAAITVLTNAINIVSTERARVGAQQNRLEATMSNVDNSSENLRAAESRIRDADMAYEMTTFVKNQILHQSSTAMLAQANALPQGVLQLLG